jgi:recombination protein RecT
MANVPASQQALVALRSEINTPATLAQFTPALPTHIPPERFKRVLLTALNKTPDLANMDRRSFWNAAMQSAQDGLLPDGREGAMVPYKGQVQWIPMVQGIRKRARNSGEILDWIAQAVYENDEFDYEFGSDPFLKHKPPKLGVDRGKMVGVYSIAWLKGAPADRPSFDVMDLNDVKKIQAKSKSANGPWSDPTFFPEMAKKTVVKRHAKQLPTSADLDDLVRRDDDLYDFNEQREERSAETKAVGGRGTSAALDAFAKAADQIPHDPETGEFKQLENLTAGGDPASGGDEDTGQDFNAASGDDARPDGGSGVDEGASTRLDDDSTANEQPSTTNEASSSVDEASIKARAKADFAAGKAALVPADLKANDAAAKIYRDEFKRLRDAAKYAEQSGGQ